MFEKSFYKTMINRTRLSPTFIVLVCFMHGLYFLGTQFRNQFEREDKTSYLYTTKNRLHIKIIFQLIVHMSWTFNNTIFYNSETVDSMINIALSKPSGSIHQFFIHL